MRERPILFSAPMIRAILDGQKTMTRRIVKITHRTPGLSACLEPPVDMPRPHTAAELCPYGQPGDRLWVREATIKVEDHGYEGPVYVESDEGRACLDGGLAPDPDDCVEVEPWELRIRPSIHMPRAYCRILLGIVSVRVQRLHDISEADAQAEGAHHELASIDSTRLGAAASYRSGFRNIWESINGAESWAANPWVWVVEFRRVDHG